MLIAQILLISLQAEKIIVFRLCCYAIYFPKKINFFQEKGLTNSNRFIEQITNRTDDQRISSLVVSNIRIANEFITV